jgi:aminopeptidase N
LGGMEYPGIVFVSAPSGAVEDVPLLPDLLRYAGFDDAASRYVIGHEVAHQWWYATVGNDQVREPWLDEAFAETSARLWLRSDDNLEQEWHMTNLVAEASPRPVISEGTNDFSSNSTYGRTIYIEGSEVLLALEERVGTPMFLEILRTWYRQEKLSEGTIAEFLETVRDVAGRGATRFLEQFR